MAISIFPCLFRKSILEIIFMKEKIKDYFDSFGIPTKKLCMLLLSKAKVIKWELFALNQ